MVATKRAATVSRSARVMWSKRVHGRLRLLLALQGSATDAGGSRQVGLRDVLLDPQLAEPPPKGSLEFIGGMHCGINNGQ